MLKLVVFNKMDTRPTDTKIKDYLLNFHVNLLPYFLLFFKICYPHMHRLGYFECIANY